MGRVGARSRRPAWAEWSINALLFSTFATLVLLFIDIQDDWETRIALFALLPVVVVSGGLAIGRGVFELVQSFRRGGHGRPTHTAGDGVPEGEGRAADQKPPRLKPVWFASMTVWTVVFAGVALLPVDGIHPLAQLGSGMLAVTSLWVLALAVRARVRADR